jgi:hypothetical protein
MKPKIGITLYLLILLFACQSIAEIEVIHLGQYADDDNVSAKNGQVWQAISVIDKKSVVIDKKLKVVPDELEENSKGIDVDIDRNGLPNLKFLVHGAPFKNKEVVQSFYLDKPLRLVVGDQPKDISFGKIKAKISTIYHFSPGQKKPREHHQAFRFVLESGQSKVMFVPPGTDNSPHEIYWIGDLNKDGFPDIFTKPDAEHYRAYFMLSKRSGKNVEMIESGNGTPQ